jgi:3-deoxy-D-manno-octulosonate 8-phosphate phosphatase (KDO 8-P phosphatase)
MNIDRDLLILKKLASIRLLAMDVDGVLTDGGVYVMDDGQQFRRFNIKDGMGIKRVMGAGIQVAWISANESNSVQERANGLGVKEVYLGITDKLTLLEEICQKMDIPLVEVAYIGDDLADLAILDRVGLAFAPLDAAEEIKRTAHYIIKKRGGEGAVREACDLLLSSISMNEIDNSKK